MSIMKSKNLSKHMNASLFLLAFGALSVISCTPDSIVSNAVVTPAENTVSIQTFDRKRIESVADSLAQRYIAAGEVPGINVAVARDGEILFSKSYGKADVEMGTDAKPETIFGIASVTKQFTAATIMRLVEAGKLSLNDPVTNYLPAYPTQGNLVTVRHLLSHTSGIPDYALRNEASPNWFRLDLSFQEMIDLWGNQPFAFKPGERHDYNNMGYYLLGQIIERVTGTSWLDYAEPNLFQPLGLEHTMFSDPRKLIPNRAKGYLHQDDTLINVPFRSVRNFSAGGGLSATTSNLIQWTHLLHSGQVVSQESLKQMVTPTVLSSGDTIGYGFGLYVNELAGHTKIYHGGTFGFGAYLAHYPEDGLTIAILSNSSKGRERAEQLETALAKVALDVRIHDLPINPDDIARYEGVYAYQSTPTIVREMRVYEEDGQLKAQLGKGKPFRLRSQGNHQFIPATTEGMRIAFHVENGRVEKLNIHEGRWEVTPATRKQ